MDAANTNHSMTNYIVKHLESITGSMAGFLSFFATEGTMLSINYTDTFKEVILKSTIALFCGASGWLGAFIIKKIVFYVGKAFANNKAAFYVPMKISSVKQNHIPIRHIQHMKMVSEFV